jgi:hypothetical protein
VENQRDVWPDVAGARFILRLPVAPGR